MEKKFNLKEKLWKDFFKGDEDYDRQSYDKVYDNIDISLLKRKTVKHAQTIDKEDIFNKIENVIDFLKKAQTEGWITLSEEWSGYETNYIVLSKYELEDDYEYIWRTYRLVKQKFDDFNKAEELKQKRLLKIKQLENEIKKLKNIK
jgi:hypothetical protein